MLKKYKIITRGFKMNKENKFCKSGVLRSESNPKLNLNHHIVLFIEQTRTERRAFEQEIAELRALLAVHGINADEIESALLRSDKILDTLLRYQQGDIGKLTRKGLLIFPYSWRRKYRNAMS